MKNLSITKKRFLMFIALMGLVTVGKAQPQWNTTINSGLYATALGYQTQAAGIQATAMGYATKAIGTRSFAFGTRAEANSSSAMAFGVGLEGNSYLSMVMGSGYSGFGDDEVEGPVPLRNNKANSLMVGFGSNLPTFFVGSSKGYGTTGRVGIATTTFPATLGEASLSTYKLFVDGGILAKEIRVRTDWADYVFDHSYTLLPLVELGQYIEENGHLPNVPSAAQVETEGIEIGEITRIQQEKIEELTLYMIQLQKQVDALTLKLEESK